MEEIDETALVESFFEPSHKEIMSELARSINEEIRRFNSTVETQERLNALNAIYEMQQHANDFISHKVTAGNETFTHVFHNRLYQRVKSEFNKLGVPSLEKNAIKAALTNEPVNPPDAPDGLKSIIANLPPPKLNRLSAVLATYEPNRQSLGDLLRNIYKPEDVQVDGYQEFHDFLQKHDIKYLGGGNSKNFKVTNIETGEILVLKVGIRFGKTQIATNRLLSNESTRDLFNETYEKRESSFQLNLGGGRIQPSIRTLSVEAYCPGGDLLTISERKQKENVNQILATGFDLLHQVGTLLIRIQENESIFTDSKLTNMLKNGAGAVVIADAKSIENSSEGRYVIEPGDEPVYTLGFDPPEFKPQRNLYSINKPNISVDKAHALIFAKDVYQFLTGCSDFAMDFVTRGHEVRFTSQETEDHFRKVPGSNETKLFSHPIFRTKAGQAFKSLILKCVQMDPSLRPTMIEAVNTLEIIKYQTAAEKEIKALYQEKLINTGMSGEVNNSPNLNQYVNDIFAAESTEEINHIKAVALEDIDKRHETYKAELTEILDEISCYAFSELDEKMDEFYDSWEARIEQLPAPNKNERQELKSILENFKTMEQDFKTLPKEDIKRHKEMLVDFDVSERFEKSAEIFKLHKSPSASDGNRHRAELQKLKEADEHESNEQQHNRAGPSGT